MAATITETLTAQKGPSIVRLVIGIVLGSYGLFGGLIIVAAIWAGLARRARRLLREHASDPA